MPELPEVEHLRRTLEPAIKGMPVRAVEVHRRSVIAWPRERGARCSLEQALLVGSAIAATHRRGKQLALEAASGRVLVVQLGMTGSVEIESGPEPSAVEGRDRHRHVVWEIDAMIGRRKTRARMVFRDPRRFGGLTAHGSMDALREAWSRLGPDGLTVTAAELHGAVEGSRRPIKSALLDQSVVAGVGNIYADESLFAARIHPLREARALTADEITRLATEIRRILNNAADQGGSTLRDYRDAFGNAGSAVQTHAVYGRADEPCLACGTLLGGIRLQGRATVFCRSCQDLSTTSTRSSGPSRARSGKGTAKPIRRAHNGSD